MNLKKTNLLIFVSFFPVFVVRSNFTIYEIIFSTLIFLLPVISLNHILHKKKKLNTSFYKFFISLIIVFGIDNNLGLWNGIIQPFRNELMNIFGIIYYPGILLIIILAFLFYLLLRFSDKKIIDVVMVFILTIFIFNIIDQSKSYKKIKDYERNDLASFKKQKVVIVFDEMSGLNSFESKTIDGQLFDNNTKKFFKKYNFEFYSNIESISGNSVSSLSSLLNFSNSKKIRLKAVKESKNYFYEYELNQNLFFEKFKSISVYQNIHTDYCTAKNISKCKTYNPFNQKKFLKGFKNTPQSKIISIWKLNGSILSTLIWRTSRELRLIDSILEPEGHKISFQSLFNNIEKDIYSQKFDLIFVHTLVPHIPYGFDQNCNYDGSLSINNYSYSTEEKVAQHNIERKCVIFFLDNFLSNLSKNKYIDKINLTILSDHGSRIIRDNNSYLSVIYGNRNSTTNYKEISEKTISQKIFSTQEK